MTEHTTWEVQQRFPSPHHLQPAYWGQMGLIHDQEDHAVDALGFWHQRDPEAPLRIVETTVTTRVTHTAGPELPDA